MKTTLIMIRHGQSVTNLTKVFTGQLDTDLTELGRLQADLAAKALKSTHIDIMYSSDLKRAVETALPTAKDHGLDIIKDERLREIFAGAWEGLNFETIRERYPEEHKIWMNNLGRMRCPGGESIPEMCERVLEAIKEIAESNLGKTVCISSHATPIRAICALTSGIPFSELEREPYLANASICIFEYENGTFTVIKKGDTSHLCGNETFLPNII